MKITLDGKEGEAASVDVGTIGQAYEVTLGQVSRLGRSVLDVRLDGKLLAHTDRETFFERSVQDFDEMLLETVDTLQLVRAALVEARGHLKPCREALQSAHSLLADGNQVRALQTLKPTLDVWMGVCEAVTKSAILIGTDLAAPLVENLSIEEAQRRMVTTVLEQARGIFENKDWVGLSDLIEYELLPLVANWERVCQALETQTTSGAN